LERTPAHPNAAHAEISIIVEKNSRLRRTADLRLV